jgi:4-hydroxy-2-oxoheptanedioate aldolase
MLGFELKKALAGGDRVYGTCVVSTAPQWPAMIAQTGLDFVFIDTEHIPIDRAVLSWMCQTFAARGLAPLVRIPKPDPFLACMVLDGGAQGVVAPYMENIDQVRELRGATKFRPLKGERLTRVLEGKERLEEPLESYIGNFNRNNLCLVNIESVAAIQRLDDLLAVPDVDGLLVGPHDLSISLDIPEDYSNKKFTEAMKTIIDKGRSAGVGVGFHYSFGIEQVIDWIGLGANLIVYSTDFFLVRDALRQDIGRLREKFGDKLAPSDGDSGAPTAV